MVRNLHAADAPASATRKDNEVVEAVIDVNDAADVAAPPAVPLGVDGARRVAALRDASARQLALDSSLTAQVNSSTPGFVPP